MSTAPLADQAARDTIRHDLDASLFVEAGAGAGKTSELVHRIVELVTVGTTPIREIAAITFTEKAASELRDRIRVEFEEVARSGGPAAALAGDALAELDDAAIGTLHAFAQRLLVEHPVEVGLPPAIEVLDEVSSQLAFDERWRRAYDELMSDPALERTMLLALGSNITEAHLRELAHQANDNWDLVDSRIPKTAPEIPHIDTSELMAAFQRCADVRDLCTDADDPLLARLDEIALYSERIVSSPDDLDLIARLRATKPSFAVRNIGRSDNWTGGTNPVRALVADCADVRQKTLDAVIPPLLRALAVHIARVTLRAADERRREGRLEFHDLLVLARSLLRHKRFGREVRAQLSRRYRRLLLDEFQDTDPIQIDLAVLLCTDDPQAHEHEWFDVRPEPGRLFVVGDPKQSIYRFRRADIEMFLRARESLGAQVVELVQNFRTVEPVTDWVNHVFGELIQPVPEMQPEYQPLIARRGPPPIGPPVTLFGADPRPVPAGARQLRAEDLRAFEADDVVAAITRVLAEGWSVKTDRHGTEESQTGEWRPARPRDICILLPARTSLNLLEPRLDAAGIPYRAETSSLVYTTREVRDLLMALRAIDDPTDQAALVATLRSPLYGCGDDDLFDYFHGAKGRWSILTARPESLPADHPVIEALGHLHALHDARHWLAPSELLDRLVRDRRVLEQGFAGRAPRDLWRRVRFVIDQARAFSDAGGGTLRDFIRWAALQTDDGVRVVESVLPETDDDSVRILTIHGAKGLEFPITILSGLTTRPQNRRGGVQLAFPPGADFAVALRKDLATSEFEQFRPVDEQMDLEEKLRLLYVGATRARDHLLVSVNRAAGRVNGAIARDKATYAELVWQVSEGVPQLWSALDPDTLVAPPTSPPPAPEADADLVAFDAWQPEIERVLAAARVPRSLSATAIAHHDLDPVAEPGLLKDPPDLELPAWQRGRYGTAIGRAVHAVLQTIDLATGAGLDHAVAAQAAAEGVAGEEPRIGALVRSALAAPTVREAVASGAYWRESYVATTVGDRIVEGYIDLVHRRPDGLVVVDYKTDTVRGAADLAAKAARYRLQGATYAHAIAEATGERVAEVVFVFCGLDEAHEVRVDDLAAARARVVEIATAK